MQRRLLRHALIAATCLAASCLSPAVQARGLKPFKAVLQFSESVGFPGTLPCFGVGVLNGSGQATVLGPVSATSQDCINPIGVPDPNAPPSFVFVSGTGAQGLVFTASNGEKVFAVYAGTLMPQAGGPHVIRGHFVITGGTGRYAGAIGGGTLQGTEDISQVPKGTGEISLSGQISY